MNNAFLIEEDNSLKQELETLRNNDIVKEINSGKINKFIPLN